jgi:TATA-box binding protein (TBP) (component of TFIID and TFIIIB)
MPTSFQTQNADNCIDDDWKKFCEGENETTMPEEKNTSKSKSKNNKKGDDAKGNDAKGNDTKGNDAKGNDTKGNDTKGEKTKGGTTSKGESVRGKKKMKGLLDDDDEYEDAFVEDEDICTLRNTDCAANDICASAADEAKVKCTALYISTQTKIAYLNMPIVLNDVFWKIPIFPYHIPQEGVVKKQMKFNSTTPEEVEDILTNAKAYTFVNHHIISQIIKPDGRIKYKDVRKVSIGLCKKDITSSRCKKKSAFYNCIVVILRLLHNEAYKEIHVKVFNTGKLEIPGIQNKEILEKVLNMLVGILHPIVAASTPEFKLNFIDHKSETVLINSNFSCGYYINREKMYELLKYKYKINSAYDPCSYPGIQCEFYYNNKTSELIHQSGSHKSCDKNTGDDYTKVSFMIFRTGSVLIVGKCTEPILYKIYDFICSMLIREYDLVKEQHQIISSALSSKKGEEETKIIKINKKGRKIIHKY